MDDGALILVGCDIYGQVYLGDNADSVQLVGCDAKTASFAGQSATALGRLLVIGSRLAAGAGVARLAGGQAELAAVSSAGAIETRLSARGDGTVAIHRRSGTQGAQLRLNDSADTTSATLGLSSDDVVIETRVAGTVAERFRLAASGAVTLSGPLTLPADPTVSTQAATKGYVDAQFTGRALTAAAISGATALTSASHNARMVIANAGATLSTDWASTGHGFSCLVVNRTGGDLAIALANFSGAIANADGNTKIKAGGIASLIAYSPDGGTTKVMHLAGAGAP